MSKKREQARRAVAESHARAAAREQSRDIMAGLRELGFRAEEARRAAEHSQGATLEARMRAALQFLGPRACVRAST